eukprot:scaffold26080_cov43-Cyclotella_meneghiniana.AAC.5
MMYSTAYMFFSRNFAAVVKFQDHNFHGGSTALHRAVGNWSPDFGKPLIGSLSCVMYINLFKTADNNGSLPLYYACLSDNTETAKYLFKLYPESISNPDD